MYLIAEVVDSTGTYPGVWKAVDADFVAGETAMNSAVRILAIAFTNEIEQRIPVSDHARALYPP